jgi:2-phospho-L-lactate guanylyltransferase (CobY/MobA/RfbA family)
MTERDLNGIIRLSGKVSVVISPSMDGGTNALMLKPPNVIKTCFGPRSFEKHINEASKKGIPIRVYRSPRISLDIDSVQDLKTLLKVGRGKVCHRFLIQIKMNKRLKEIEPSAGFSNLF